MIVAELKAPRAGAVAGILFSILLIISVVFTPALCSRPVLAG